MHRHIYTQGAHPTQATNYLYKEKYCCHSNPYLNVYQISLEVGNLREQTSPNLWTVGFFWGVGATHKINSQNNVPLKSSCR